MKRSAFSVYRLLPSKHRLALLFLDWSGARISAIDRTLVGDYDEARRRVRLRKQATKTRKALWIELHPELADALDAALGPREDRDPEARLFVMNSWRTIFGTRTPLALEAVITARSHGNAAVSSCGR